MGELHVQHLQPGMELAEDILSFNGSTLLKKGAILTEKHLHAFDMWGVTEANIKGAESAAQAARHQADICPEIAQQIASDLNRLFEKTDLNDPVTAELYRIRQQSKHKARVHEKA